MSIANAPGEKIYPGELAKALKLLKAGKEIDYVGATALELIGSGESSGSFAEILIDSEQAYNEAYNFVKAVNIRFTSEIRIGIGSPPLTPPKKPITLGIPLMT